MAGRGQHFIPRHFQKPFVISNVKDQLWMYRRGKADAILIARGDAAKAHDFYSSPSPDGDTTLDDLITEYEQKIFPMIDDLRDLPIGAQADAQICAEIVVHFFVRSQHLRNAVSEIWNGLSKLIFSLSTDPSSVIGSRRLPAHSAPANIATAIKEQIYDHKLDEATGVSADTLARIIYLGLRENLDELMSQAKEMISLIVQAFGAEAKDKIRDMHRDMLSSSLAPPKRVEKLQKLHWKILDHKASSAIIPDCVCIAADAEGVWQPLIFVSDVVTAVIPLTPHTLLVGTAGANHAFDADQFNSLAANACFDFFLSKEKVDLKSILKNELGQQIRTEISNMVSTNVIQAIEAYLTAPISNQAAELNQLSVDFPPKEQYSYQVSFYDFGDMAYVEAVSDAVSKIILKEDVKEVFEALDGFTFADDYEGALNSLDRGFTPSGSIKSVNSPLGFGVAMPLTVKVDDQFKTRFILRGFLAADLVGEDEAAKQAAASTVRYLVAGLALDYLERTRFPGWMLQKIATPIENYLFSYASGIFSTYFKMRRSSYLLEDAFKHLEAIEDNITEIYAACVQKRREYRINADLDSFINSSFEQAETLLSQIARVLGISGGREGDHVVSERLRNALAPFGLGDWVKLFAVDLAIFYDNLDAWKNFEEAFFANRHFERVLLTFSIIVQEQDDGTFYIHVPLGSDAEYLSQIANETS